ncbi:hypothetical protein ACFFGT_02800 [Mucilaginibacter angelicae]|uniref:Uncharacterized protein n=1 Tax=Mucilaginibacter angelicae TaxID=869718 RepID=A0ABV6L051_9SPHI
MIQEIHTIEDVEVFMRDLAKEGVNAHPDELFENYVNIKTNEPTFSAEDATLRNSLMERSFVICKDAGIDIYDFMQEIFLKETGLDKYIPLPSSVRGI